MKSGRRQFPDFAGVALVDILANGVAVLIIVIVTSLAARMEQEKRYAEQVEDISTVMSRRFATSLVLNRLTASQPAVLHDYQTSELDQTLDPSLLPILELHRGYVREFYSGQVWPRSVLLREPNTMDVWLEKFTPEMKQRLRIDVYDIAQFYITLSVLRDHQVAPAHWHFLGGQLDLAQARRCPGGVSAADCLATEGEGVQAANKIPEVFQSGVDGDWAPDGIDEWGQGGYPGGRLPGGVAYSDGYGAAPGAGETGSEAGGVGSGATGAGRPGGRLNSFPNADGAGEGRRRGLLGRVGAGENSGGQSGSGQSEGGRLRLASPASLFPDAQSPLALDLGSLGPEATLGALLRYAAELQSLVDEGRPVHAHIHNFRGHIMRLLLSPYERPQAEQEIIDQVWAEWRNSLVFHAEQKLVIQPEPLTPAADSALLIEPNRLLSEAAVAMDASALSAPEQGWPVLSLNLYPDIWHGLQITLKRKAMLLLPPAQQFPERRRWRAVVYVSPRLDDHIVGFVHAAIDESGRLRVDAENNRVRLDRKALSDPHVGALFGIRGWLLALYVCLGLGLLAILAIRLMTAPDEA